jgi:hypothetical protein
VETWAGFWARALDECLANDLPVPPEEVLRAEYIERARQLAALDAWSS